MTTTFGIITLTIAFLVIVIKRKRPKKLKPWEHRDGQGYY